MATATGRGTPGHGASYCVIGTGFSGTCALWHLVQRLTAPGRPHPAPDPAPSIVTVERGPVSGPGYPYDEDNVQLAHLCNNEAGSMGLHGTDFVDWLTENRQRLWRECPGHLLETHPGAGPDTWKPDPRAFYPRALFGRYLRERFQQAVERARAHGITVHTLTRHEALDGFTAPDGFRVLLRDLDTGRETTLTGLDRVLLATGHWQPAPTGRLTGHDGYLAAPYPPQAVRHSVRARARTRRTRPGADARPVVFVEGMGPSGIDAILTLCADGTFTHTPDGHIDTYRPHGTPPRVVAGSRSGFFPPVRGPLPPYEPQLLTEENLAAIRRAHHGRLRLAPVLELLDAELRRATDGAAGWEDVARPPYADAREKLAYDLRASATGDLVHAVVLKARRLRFYHRLAPDDKAAYDRLFDTHIIRTAVPMPAANAEKLLALMDAGVLTTVRLGYGTTRTEITDDGTFRVTAAPDDGPAVTVRADCVVRARGQDFRLERHPSPLVQNLLRRGEIVPHEEGGYTTGGIALDPGGGHRVLRRAGGALGPSPHLSSFGPVVRFWQNEKNYAGAFVEAARSVVDDWAGEAAAGPPAAVGPAAVDGAGLVGSETGR
ncbi:MULTISPECIES: FAD/NAD(P)-binding protein [unclassified Streptomyces]|jgi:uncharacterized NAD(P)/FAD-binding protein YdhS|uniref:FAD/NAD(P)-binding protein n=1 Tax=unclassified Streptomyces TaxID=2593676 RepID=UPI0033BA33BF